MKFIVDAQLPRRLAKSLCGQGYDAIHTLDLAQGNLTKDSAINRLSIAEQRVVISKDADFVNSFLVSKKPYKLLLVSTGNITNQQLESLFAENIHAIVSALQTFDYVELTRNSLIEHA